MIKLLRMQDENTQNPLNPVPDEGSSEEQGSSPNPPAGNSTNDPQDTSASTPVGDNNKNAGAGNDSKKDESKTSSVGEDSKKPPTPSKDEKDPIVSPLQSDDELSEDQFITGGDDHSFITGVPIPAHPNTQFDEKEFLRLLAASISLTKVEKQRIIASIPKLSQYQIDELMRIFGEEQKKFSELNKKHANQLKELESKHKDDWNDIEMQAKQEDKSKKDEDEASKLRKKLGL